MSTTTSDTVRESFTTGVCEKIILFNLASTVAVNAPCPLALQHRVDPPFLLFHVASTSCPSGGLLQVALV